MKLNIDKNLALVISLFLIIVWAVIERLFNFEITDQVILATIIIITLIFSQNQED